MTTTLESLKGVSTAELLSAAGRRMRSLQLEPPTPKKLAPCTHCGLELGARERRKHEPACRRAQQEPSQHGDLPRRSRDGLEPELHESTAPTAAEAARNAMEQCRVSDPRLVELLSGILAADPGLAVDTLVTAFDEYRDPPSGLKRAWSAFSFFSEEHWRNRASWLYEEESPPPNTQRRANDAGPRW